MKRLLVGLIVGLVLLLAPTAAWAHPLGNFTVNRYSRIEIGPDSIQLRYVLDLAEIPTLQELGSDAPLGSRDESFRQQLLDAKAAELVGGAHLIIDDRPLSWRVESA